MHAMLFLLATFHINGAHSKAARNVLVDAQRVAKVADFGLSRGTNPLKGNTDGNERGAAGEEEQTYYRSKTGVFAVRWTAPECMEDLTFTAASDVWSFGVVLTEEFENGRTRVKHTRTHTRARARTHTTHTHIHTRARAFTCHVGTLHFECARGR